MYTVNNEVLLNEAASVISRHENVSVDFVFARYTTRQIFGRCKAYNDQHLENIDTIRQ